MGKKRTVGIGKTKHWNEGRRVKNARKRRKNMFATIKPEAAEIIEEKNPILRKREGKK